MLSKLIAVLFGAISVAALLIVSLEARETVATANPLTGNAAAIVKGDSLFRANCSRCHGLNARGGSRGPDLTSGHWVHGSSDADIFRTITRGVPGTQMPANDLEDSEAWSIIAYLRSLAPSAHRVAGDPMKGETLFFQTEGCAACHMVRGRGGSLGPDLSRVGASRSTSYLIDSIREPSKDLSVGVRDPNDHYGLPLVYDTVTLVTNSGTRIRGIAKNEDTFSIQLLDTNQNLRLFLKADLKQVIHEQKSLMPLYSNAMLSETQLQDLIAFLETLR